MTLETFEILGLSVKLSKQEASFDPTEVVGCIRQELEKLPVEVKKKSAAQQLLLVALKIASDKLVLTNQVVQELSAMESILKEQQQSISPFSESTSNGE